VAGDSSKSYSRNGGFALGLIITAGNTGGNHVVNRAIWPNSVRPKSEISLISSALPGICVFCGSSHGDDPSFARAARVFGRLLVKNGFRLVFGGGRIGLMGEVAIGVTEEDGEILGIIPSFLRHLEPPLRAASKIVVTETLNERKTKMFEAAQGFAVLAGGLGTFDEFFEALTEGQLQQHTKPIVLINTNNYFEPLIDLIDHSIAHGFTKPATKDLITIVDTPEDAIKVFIDEILEAEISEAGPGAV
jgi:uncharacterized protein (TIGR00730 family)